MNLRPLKIKDPQILENMDYEDLYKYDFLECYFSIEEFLNILDIEASLNIFFEQKNNKEIVIIPKKNSISLQTVGVNLKKREKDADMSIILK